MDNQNYGTVEYKGKTLTIKQSPYLNYNTVMGDHYKSMAEDEEGNEYIVRWDIINPDCEDESDACDWQDYQIEEI